MDPDLRTALADALARLAEGAADPASRWRTMALATVAQDGTPAVRTVVLRRFDQCARILDVHTDIRSAKYRELLAKPAAALHGWDSHGAVQLRVAATATLHSLDAVAHQSWDRLRPATKATYAVRPGPGTALPAPDALLPDATQDQASRTFCVVRLRLHAVEWLHLAQGSHRRARFVWMEDAMTGMWLVP